MSSHDPYAVHPIRDRPLTPSGEVHVRSALREDYHLELVERPIPHRRRQSEALDADAGGVVPKEGTGIAFCSGRSRYMHNAFNCEDDEMYKDECRGTNYLALNAANIALALVTLDYLDFQGEGRPFLIPDSGVDDTRQIPLDLLLRVLERERREEHS